MNVKPPKYKGKGFFTTLYYNQNGFDIKNNIITFSHKHPSKTGFSFDISHCPLEKGARKIK